MSTFLTTLFALFLSDPFKAFMDAIFAWFNTVTP